MEIYALVLAGGSGERFWPLSRRALPKQLLRLGSSSSLLEATIARLEGLIPPARILVLTNVDQEKGVRQALKKFPDCNIIAEPSKRDTAAAVALGVAWVAARDHTAAMAVLPADHVIKDTAAFQKILRDAVDVAQGRGALITIGIRPTSADPGFGYIEMGEPISGKPGLSRVVRFREKPNVDLAESFIRKGNFRWNAGMSSSASVSVGPVCHVILLLGEIMFSPNRADAGMKTRGSKFSVFKNWRYLSSISRKRASE